MKILTELTNRSSNIPVYAQANQLDKLMALKKTTDVATKKLMRDYGYQTAIWNRKESS